MRAAGCGPALVLAGPGTGKTTTLVEAVAARVEAGGDPQRILVLTFSRKAAAELRSRIAARLGGVAPGHLAWTFHAYAYALLGALPVEPGAPSGRLRLLSGPEQDVVVRELVAGDVAGDGVVRWPADLRAALGTRGFADEVRGLLARVRALGWGSDRLRAEAATSAGRPEWEAAADFLDEYSDNLAAQGALDYSELVAAAVAWAESPAGAGLADRYDLVVVDEYQDTDPGQERLLRVLAGRGRDLLVVGDPDQSIYAFRGAEVRGLLDFPDRFPRRTGSAGAAERAPVFALRVCRRSGPALVAASRSVARRLPAPGGLEHDPASGLPAFRSLSAVEGAAPGAVEVATYATAGAQYDAVADRLRRAHLEQGVPWSQMAVLVRSGARSVAAARRALGAHGVPVVAAGDDLPMAREPAVQPLLTALRCVADPAELTDETARALLLSPLVGADPPVLRRLARALRDEERTASPDRPPRFSDALVREAVEHPERLVAHADDVAGPARRLAALLADARSLAAAGASAYAVLWSLWHGTAWAARLERQALAGGPAGRAADRDLDAILALFDAAARDEERIERRGLAAFLAELSAQQIPGDSLDERGVRGGAVRLLTAHRAKGLEWELVCVVDVQEDLWPDVRPRGSLLQPDRLGPDGLREPLPASALLAEERRLFYVAVTRARRRLVVTAVDSPDEDGVRASRFLAELGVEVRSDRSRQVRPLTLRALVAELRSVAADPAVEEPLRKAAAERLARLAAAREGDHALAPAADPQRWWGVRELTDPGVAMYPDDRPLRLSGSSLARMEDCALRWFFEHEAKAASARTTALGFGSIVHALAAEVAADRLEADEDVISGQLSRVWQALSFEARWQSPRQYAEAQDCVRRFLAWHAANPRTLLAAEHAFELEVPVGDRRVVLRGSFDRVELDDGGRVVVVDLKTGAKAVTGAELARHVQLGVYQLAVRSGAVSGLLPAAPGEPPPDTAAELVQLRIDDAGHPKVQPQEGLAADAEPEWVDGVLAAAVDVMSGERFAATPGSWCAFCAFTASCPAVDHGRQVIE